MLNPRILDLIARIDAARDPAALRRLLVEALSALGLPHVAYCNVSEFQKTGNPASLQTIMTFPEDWTAYYRARHYAAIDPVFHAARFRRRPFRWQDLNRPENLSTRQRRLMAEAAAAGMAHGLTVPLFGPDGEHAVLSVASPEPLEDCPASPSTLAAIATHFHLTHQDLVDGAAREEPAPVPLYPREREVLLWCARGKTSWEIGRILNLAERTVDHYAEQAMSKLQAPNRVAAVLKATRHGLIAP